MFGTPIRCGSYIKGINHGVLAIGYNNVGLADFARAYSEKGKSCSPHPEQTGKTIQPWPKNDPPPQMWRAECPQQCQPPNYDPYRIKVPDIVVPPLAPSNAKPMLECSKIKGPCSVKPPPEQPPCPPPPRKPFNWIYLKTLFAVFGTFGLVYKILLWYDEKQKLSQSQHVWQPRRVIKNPFHDRDLPPCVQYLIIGTGAAGWAAYEAIMEHDKSAKVFFITKEDAVPYIRPPLTKGMWWNNEPPDINNLRYVEDERIKSMYLANCTDFMDPIKFYRKSVGPAVSIASGWCVLRVDADDHVAYIKTMSGEQPMYYERCLLAPGSKPINLSIFKAAPKRVRDKVTTMRSIRDLEVAFRKVRAAKSVVIIGGGNIGCELAYYLSRMNKVLDRGEDAPPLEVTHIVKDKGILGNLLPGYLGEWAAEKLRCEGVNVISNTQVYDAFESKDGRLELTLSNGKSLVTDYAFVAVGAKPRTELAEPSFLEVDEENGGFLVNTELEARTHLYVAGDAASYYSQWKDTRLRTEHYSSAEEQGSVAGANMAGAWRACNMEPHYWLRLGPQIQMEMVGECGACYPIVGLFKNCPGPEETPEEQAAQKLEKKICFQEASKEYQYVYQQGLLFYMRDEHVVGFVFWNLPPIEDRKDVATELLRARPTYKDIDTLAELLGFRDAQCVYKLTNDQGKKADTDDTCTITNRRVFSITENEV